ncbi:MAG: PEP-CTERM sorting domain-containing protein [Sphingomonadaceae bacterium]|jgi:hypothetical protein
MIKFPLKLIAALGAFAFSTAPAAADVFTYNMTNGDTLSINSDTQSATYVGSTIDVSMTSADFASFAGGANPTFTAVLSSLDGLRLIGGKWLTDNPKNVDTTHPQKLIFEGNGRVNLWAWWGDPIVGGDYIKNIGSYSHTPTNPVPEPGMLGLLALGAGGVAFARRRRKQVRQASPKLAFA